MIEQAKSARDLTDEVFCITKQMNAISVLLNEIRQKLPREPWKNEYRGSEVARLLHDFQANVVMIELASDEADDCFMNARRLLDRLSEE